MLTTGSRLGPYEITAQLGAGGMGEVYRARDSRLDRTVAIKVLPARLSSDPRLRERFEREARAISALTHPHICTLYDVGSHDGTDFLVMEYLDGESLADRLARGPLPIDQVIRYGTEIAEALEKAHRAGIVHRDLKPGNVVITKGGAKLLDFGLAKFSLIPSRDDSEESPAGGGPLASLGMTQRKPLTEEGAILGTFQYMAPEQIEGGEADARTDIFALGVVLYEMATGKRAFEAKTKASLIASILDREPPPISQVQPLTPPAFERVVRMCLAKDPDERWQSAHDIAAELKWIATTSSETIGPGARRSRMRHLGRAAAFIAAGLLIGTIGTWLLTRNRMTPRPVSRYTINAAPNAPAWMGVGTMALSPDGTRMVYRSYQPDKTSRLHARSSGNLVWTTLTPGGAWLRSPVFSPDSRWIAYLDGPALRKVSVDGGAPVTVHPSVGFGGLGVDWEGDTIYYSVSFTDGIWAVHQNGGQSRQIAKVDPSKNIRAVVWPHVLPGGKTLLATVWSAGSWDDAKIVAYSLTDGSSKVVLEGSTRATYVSTGHLLFGRGTNVMAVRFDPETLAVSGNPIAVVGGVATDVVNGEPQYAVSDSGDLLYIAGGLLEDTTSLVMTGFDGTETPVTAVKRPYADPELSPDGRTIAVTIQTATFDIWLLDAEREVTSRISYGGDDSNPTFTPDGRYVVWQSSRHGTNNIFRAPVDSSGGEERLTTSSHQQIGPTVSPDGRDLLYSQFNGVDWDIWRMPFDTRKPEIVLATRFDEWASRISPDGKWLIYISKETGKTELYVRPYPEPGGKWQVSTGGAFAGGWTHDGRRIIYRTENKVYAVEVETSPTFRVGRPRLLFDREYDEEGFDVTEKGLLFVKDPEKTVASSMTIVLNWTDELKRRVPVP